MSPQKIVALALLAASAVRATDPSGWDCEDWHESWCPAWDFGDECFTGNQMPIKKFKCEQQKPWLHGYWNYKGEVRDTQFPACTSWQCNGISNGAIDKCKSGISDCDICSCVKGYVMTCGPSNYCKYTDSRLTATGRRRMEALEEILGLPAAHH